MWLALFLTAAFLVSAFVEWKNRLESVLPPLEEDEAQQAEPGAERRRNA